VIRWNALLLVVIVLSALAVVAVRFQSRQAFMQVNQLQHERDRLNDEWGQLLLEQGAFAELSQVEQKARQNLKMYRPSPEQIVYITYPEK